MILQPISDFECQGTNFMLISIAIKGDANCSEMNFTYINESFNVSIDIDMILCLNTDSEEY